MLSREENELLTRVHAIGQWVVCSGAIGFPRCCRKKFPNRIVRRYACVSWARTWLLFATARGGSGLWANTVPIAALRCFTAATKSAVLGAFIMVGNTISKAMCSKLLPSLPGVS